MMKKILGWDWGRLLMPRAWLQVGKADNEWDAILNDSIDKHGVQRVDKYTARSGGLSLWVENYPYAYGFPHGIAGLRAHSDMILPRVRTRRRIYNILGDFEEILHKENMDRIRNAARNANN